MYDKVFASSNKEFCDLTVGCVYNKEKNCISVETMAGKTKEISINDIIEDYRNSMETTFEERNLNLQEKYKNSMVNIEKHEGLRFKQTSRFDKQQRTIGLTLDDVETITSPYEPLFLKILGQQDFSARQSHLLHFTTTFVHEARPQDEDTNWLYCNLTNVKLVPSFFKILAVAYLKGNTEYMRELEVVCSERGSISDDGDSWIDKHSGYVIKKIEHTGDEGYDESGFKMISRDIMEEDVTINDDEISGTGQINEYKSKAEYKAVYKIMKGISSQMNISIMVKE